MHALSREWVFPTLLLIAAAGCSGADGAPTGINASSVKIAASRTTTGVATITVTPNPASVAVGASIQLSTALLDALGNVVTSSQKIHWSSSDTTVAQVNQSGSITGRKNGTVTITASVNGVSGTSKVTVGTGTTTATTTTTTTTSPTTTTSTTGTTGTTGTTSTTSTTTTTTTSPTSGTISSTGGGLSGLALYADDFTSYHSTADLWANINTAVGGTGGTGRLYNDGGNGQLTTLDSTVLYNGHPTMRYNQPGGTGATPELFHWFPSGVNLSHMWFRAKIRFSPGWTDVGTLTNCANAYKMLGWGWSGFYGRGTVEITNTTEYELYWLATSTTTGATLSGGNFSNAGSVTTEWTDGRWYEYIIEYQVTSDTTAVSRVWMAPDGQTPVLMATTPGTGAVGTIPSVHGVFLGMNFNQVRTATQNQALWYAEWEVVDGTQHSNPFNLPGV